MRSCQGGECSDWWVTSQSLAAFVFLQLGPLEGQHWNGEDSHSQRQVDRISLVSASSGGSRMQGSTDTERRRRRRTCRPASLTVNLQHGSDSPRELLRLLSQSGSRPRTLLVAREALRRRPDFYISRAAKREERESTLNHRGGHRGGPQTPTPSQLWFSFSHVGRRCI